MAGGPSRIRPGPRSCRRPATRTLRWTGSRPSRTRTRSGSRSSVAARPSRRPACAKGSVPGCWCAIPCSRTWWGRRAAAPRRTRGSRRPPACRRSRCWTGSTRDRAGRSRCTPPRRARRHDAEMRTPAPADRRSLSPRPGPGGWSRVSALEAFSGPSRCPGRPHRGSRRPVAGRRRRGPEHRGCPEPVRHPGRTGVGAYAVGRRAAAVAGVTALALAHAPVRAREPADADGEVVLHHLAHLRLREGLVGTQRVLDARGGVLGADGHDAERRAGVGVVADLAQAPGELGRRAEGRHPITADQPGDGRVVDAGLLGKLALRHLLGLELGSQPLVECAAVVGRHARFWARSAVLAVRVRVSNAWCIGPITRSYSRPRIARGEGRRVWWGRGRSVRSPFGEPGPYQVPGRTEPDQLAGVATSIGCESPRPFRLSEKTYRIEPSTMIENTLITR